jgi:DNA-directed RNA polymerase specialized sigma24 family protein
MNREEIFAESNIRRLHRTARAIFARHGLSPDDGEDLVQQMLFLIHQNDRLVRKIRSMAFLTTWLENRAKDMDRAKARRKFVEISDFIPATSDTGRTDRELQKNDLKMMLGPSLLRALCELKGTRYRAMVLYLIRLISEGSEPPYREIAVELGTSIATVCRARDQLRNALSDAISDAWQVSGSSCRRYHRSRRTPPTSKLLR